MTLPDLTTQPLNQSIASSLSFKLFQGCCNHTKRGDGSCFGWVGWPGLAWAGLGWPGLAWAANYCINVFRNIRNFSKGDASLFWPGLRWAGLGQAGLDRPVMTLENNLRTLHDRTPLQKRALYLHKNPICQSWLLVLFIEPHLVFKHTQKHDFLIRNTR